VKAAAHDLHDGTNDIIALEADEAFMARLSTPRGSNSVAQSETRRTGLAQMLTPTHSAMRRPIAPRIYRANLGARADR
jgi:hypothetical protein